MLVNNAKFTISGLWNVYIYMYWLVVWNMNLMTFHILGVKFCMAPAQDDTHIGSEV